MGDPVGIEASRKRRENALQNKRQPKSMETSVADAAVLALEGAAPEEILGDEKDAEIVRLKKALEEAESNNEPEKEEEECEEDSEDSSSDEEEELEQGNEADAETDNAADRMEAHMVAGAADGSVQYHCIDCNKDVTSMLSECHLVRNEVAHVSENDKQHVYWCPKCYEDNLDTSIQDGIPDYNDPLSEDEMPNDSQPTELAGMHHILTISTMSVAHALPVAPSHLHMAPPHGTEVPSPWHLPMALRCLPHGTEVPTTWHLHMAPPHCTEVPSPWHLPIAPT